MEEFRAGKSAGGVRVDVFVAKKYPSFSRSALKGLFERQNVRVNDQSARPGHKLKPEDRVAVNPQSLYARPQPIKLPVLYEDDAVVVIDKPAGVLTHSKGALNLEPTVASFIRPKLHDKTMGGNRAGIVHRLDRATSGVIICARNQKALIWLQKQFLTRKAKKTYIAVAEGVPRPTKALIDVPIARNPRKPQTFKAIADGRPAQTGYKIIKAFKKGGQDFALIKLEPLTGRTHQIRVHLAYIGHPVAGDYVYGKADGTKMLLHAQKLELTLPNGQKKVFSAPLPPAFNKFIKSK